MKKILQNNASNLQGDVIVTKKDVDKVLKVTKTGLSGIVNRKTQLLSQRRGRSRHQD